MKNKYAKEKKAENDRIMSFENINYLLFHIFVGYMMKKNFSFRDPPSIEIFFFSEPFFSYVYKPVRRVWR